MGVDLLLVAGIPATGKTRFGAWLREEHGYVHVDWENQDSRHRWRLEEAWEQYVARIDQGNKDRENPELVGEDCGPIMADALIGLGERVVLDWGFPPVLWRAVGFLRQRGFSLWWFDADGVQARRLFEDRARAHRFSEDQVQADLGAFDTQIDNVRIWWGPIEDLFWPNFIEALDDTGNPAHPADIYHQICGGGKP